MIFPDNLYCSGSPSGKYDNFETESHDSIERVYLEVLQRVPDAEGLETYLYYLQEENKSEEWLREVLVNSDEGQQIRTQSKRRMYVISAFAAFFLLLCGLAFCYRKSTSDFICNCLLVFLYFCIACVFLEIGLRVTAHYQVRLRDQPLQKHHSSSAAPENTVVFLRDMIQASENPGLVYEMKKNLSVDFMGGRVTTDRNGFRITPGSCEKPASYTVLGLGDSVMFGWGVHDHETYLSSIAQKMSRECSRIINMSVPGYNAVMKIEALEKKGLQFQPELVILHFVDNDLNLPNFIQKKDKQITRTPSYLLAALSRWQGIGIRTHHTDHLARPSEDVPGEYKDMVGVEAYRRAMMRFTEMGRKHGFQILLLANWKAPDYAAEIASELKLPVIELGKLFERYCRENRVSEFQGSALTVTKNDPHLSPLAHRIVAEEVYNFISNNNNIIAVERAGSISTNE